MCIDIGTYSIKASLFDGEGRILKLKKVQEVPLKSVGDDLYPDSTLYEKQLALAADLIGDDFDGKVYFQLPHEMVTSRYLNIPVTQKKKVDLMIPFQLDENLPYSMSNAHYITQQTKLGSETSVVVNVTKKSDFEKYFQTLKENFLSPTAVTSELSVVHSLAVEKKIPGPMAIIDIGHTTTKCYIIYNERVILNHINYSAGGLIDEAIASTYNIDLDEAVIYKHQNCFFLSDQQIATVNEKQREFALLMKSTMMPLISDIKRWLIGFRVKHGLDLSSVYLTGGTSRIKNIHGFIGEQLGLQVQPLSSMEGIKDRKKLLANQQDSFFMTTLMAQSFKAKQKPGNFLSGEYSTGSSMELPLHSMAFIGLRSALLFLFLTLFVGIDTYMVTAKNKKLDKQIQKQLKDPSFNISRQIRKRWKKKVKVITKKLNTQKRVVTQEVKTLMSSNKIDAIEPLFKVNQVLMGVKDVELTSFNSNQGSVSGTLKSKNQKDAEKIRKRLKSSSLQGIEVSGRGNISKFNFTEN